MIGGRLIRFQPRGKTTAFAWEDLKNLTHEVTDFKKGGTATKKLRFGKAAKDALYESWKNFMTAVTKVAERRAKKLLPERLENYSESKEFGEGAKSKIEKKYITDVDVRVALDQVFKFKSVSQGKIKELMMGDGIITRNKKKQIDEDADMIARIQENEERFMREMEDISDPEISTTTPEFDDDESQIDDDPMGFHKSFFVTDPIEESEEEDMDDEIQLNFNHPSNKQFLEFKTPWDKDDFDCTYFTPEGKEYPIENYMAFLRKEMIEQPELFDEDILENAKAFGAAVILNRNLLVSATLPIYATECMLGNEKAQDIISQVKDDLNKSIAAGPNEAGEYEGITEALEKLVSLQAAEREELINPIAYDQLDINEDNINFIGENECAEWMLPMGVGEWGTGGNYFCVLDKDNPGETDLLEAFNCSTLSKCLENT